MQIVDKYFHHARWITTDKDGRFTALRVTTWAAMGGYLSNFGPFIPQLAAPMISAGREE